MDQRLNERRGKIRTWFFIMEKEIINKVAKSPIVTLDLEEGSLQSCKALLVEGLRDQRAFV